MSNPVQKAILDRRSTRGFDGKPLTDAEIQNLIDAALASPSAMNRQPWHFSFVKDADVIAEFNAVTRKHMLENGPDMIKARFADPEYKLLMGAPLFVIISKAKANDGFFTPIDCGIAVENLALSAMGMGLGSVIVGMPKDILENSPIGSEFKQKMGVPAENEYVVGILIGHNTVTKEAHPIEENRYTVV